MRSSLLLRIAGTTLAVMAGTLLVAALLTQQLIRVEHRADLDDLLRREATAVRLGLPPQLQAAQGSDGRVVPAEFDVAVQRYLALHPGSPQHLTIVTVGSRRLSTGDGPAEVIELHREGRLPAGPVGLLTTVDSPAGPVRILTAPLQVGGQDHGVVTVAGPMAPGQAQASQAFVRIGLASAIGLLLGGLLLVLALRPALRPVHDLATAARSADLRDLAVRISEPASGDEVAVMAAEFNRMLDRIQTGELQRRQLLAAVSHELRTPLAVARGHLELLETLGPDEGQTAADTAAVVRRELDRLARIVDDLAAITRGDLAAETARQPVFAPDVLTELQARLAGLDTDAQVSVKPGPPLVLLGDEDRLTQALLALVVNATTHTPPGTGVTVDAVADDHAVAFRVADSGPGIPADLAATVFEPFVTTKPDGPARASGLGLSVVKAVTEAQNGTVDLITGPDGTTVTLTLPLDDDAVEDHQA